MDTKQVRHTPGPWELAGLCSVVARIGKKNNPNVAQLVDGLKPTEELRANGLLIAAAPELLEALQAALAYNDAVMCVDGTGQFSWAANARAAIAKATGSAQ